MDKLLLKLGITFLSGKLNGKKTYLGAAVLILLGISRIGVAVAGFLGQFATDIGAPNMDTDTCLGELQAGFAMFGAGLATGGLGHKIEKTTAS